MPNDKKPKPDPFFSGSGDEFRKEVPEKGWEPPPPDPPPEPAPPPPKPRIGKEECGLVFRIVSFLTAYAYVREKAMAQFPSQMRKGFSLAKVKEALQQVGIPDIDALPMSVYANPHVSGIRRVSHAVVSLEIDELVDGLIAPHLTGPDRSIADTFFRHLAIGCKMKRITEAALLEEPEEKTPPGTEVPQPLGPYANPWGPKDD